MPIEKNCGNCAWFDGQPEIELPVGLQKMHDAVWKNRKPPVYGKCTAVFVDIQGNLAKHDFGTFSTSACSALDARSKKLFALGVYPRGNSTKS